MKDLSLLKSKLYSIMIGFLIFLIPSNLFYKISDQDSFVRGLQVDYLIYKVYLSDLYAWLLIIISFFLLNSFSFRKFTQTYKKHITFFIITGLLIFNQLLTSHPLISTWFGIKLIVLVILGLQIHKNSNLLDIKIIYPSILISVFFQSLVAWYQFIWQKSVAGYLFLGESNLSKAFGLAKLNWQGSELVLPYGTTPHPNVLAGFLVIFILLSIWLLPNWLASYHQSKISESSLITIYCIWLLMASSTLVITFSYSAWLSLLMGISILILKPTSKTLVIIFFSLILLIPLMLYFLAPYAQNQPSIIRRFELNQTALKMFYTNLFGGVGFNTFTLNLESYSNWREVVRFVQPTHHIGLLWLAETGLIGGIWLLYLLKISWWWLKPKLPLLVALTPIFALDHYFLTIQSGFLSLIVFLTISRLDLKN